MPIRITCPSCSATLSLKDEAAGRSVKCPKCASVIPPPLPPEPGQPPAPVPAPFEKPDEPEKPAKGGKIAGKPSTRSRDDNEDEDEDARPRKKHRDEEDEEPPRKKAKRPADEDEDDRPARRRRGADEDEDDRPGRGKKPAKKSNAGLILGIVGGLFLTCCGGGLGLGYYFFVKVKDAVQDELNPKNDKVTLANYRKIKPGMTRTEVEAILGSGKVGTRDKLVWISNGATTTPTPNPLTPVREENWGPKFASGRVYIWQNDTDAAFILFHPDAGPGARVQMTEFMSKTGENVMDVQYREDADFVRAFPGGAGPKKDDPTGDGPKKPAAGDKTGAVTSITAAELIDDCRADPTGTDRRFQGKRLLVTEAVVESWENGYTAQLRAKGAAKPTGIRVIFLDEQQAQIAKYKPGDTIKFRGSYISGSGGTVQFTRGWIVP